MFHGVLSLIHRKSGGHSIRMHTFISMHPVLLIPLFGIGLLAWRLWSFTILPSLYPQSPRTLPYWIPWFGHSFHFFRDAEKTITQARIYFGNKREPFALVLGGQYIYIVTSAKDVTEVYRNAEYLAFNEYVKDVMRRFGASPEGVARTWDSPHRSPNEVAHKKYPIRSENSISNHCESIIQAHLYPGVEMHKLRDAFLLHLHQNTTLDTIPISAILATTPSHKVVSLQKWVKGSLLECITTTFFGRKILEIEPEFLEAFARFDDCGWKLMYKVPSYLAKDMHSAKRIMQNAFEKYFDLPFSERIDACPMIQKLESELRVGGCAVNDLIVYLLMLYWGINANAWKATFWLVAHILHDERLKEEIAGEILPCLSENLSVTDLQERLETSCPILKAAYNEVLRTTVSSITARDVMRTCTIGSSRLERNARVIVPYRQMLLDEQIFGPDAATFNPYRFLQHPELIKDPSFRPFGGGLAYCPGRYVARMEILALTTIILGKFNLARHDPLLEFPAMQTAKPCLGVMNTVPGQDVILNVRPKAL